LIDAVRPGLRLSALFTATALLSLILGRLTDGIGVLLYTREVIRNAVYIDLPDIYLHDLDRSLIINLTRTPDQLEIAPVWSSDGLRLAYVAYALHGGSRRVCVIDFGQPDRCFDTSGGWHDQPAWVRVDQTERLMFIAYDSELGPSMLVESVDDGQIRPVDPTSELGAAFYAARLDVQSGYSAPVTADGRWAIIPTPLRGGAHLLLVDLRDASAPARQISWGRGDFFFPAWQPR